MGGGGGDDGGYEATYYAYDHVPDSYLGQNEINQASANINRTSVRTINSRIIPNMVNIDYYRLVNRLHLEATDAVNDETSAFVENYPQHILAKIITIEEAYQRINDYIRFFATFDKNDFKIKLENHKQWFLKTSNELCALKDRADYYKRRLEIQQQIEEAIVAKRRDYLSNTQNTATIPFELVIPSTLSRDDNFKISYINELDDTPEGTDRRFRLYMSLPPPQTGNV